jgi:hypothetical protein
MLGNDLIRGVRIGLQSVCQELGEREVRLLF